MFNGGLLRRGVKSGWANSARQNEVVVAEGSGAFAHNTLSMCMEVRAISEAIMWLREICSCHLRHRHNVHSGGSQPSLQASMSALHGFSLLTMLVSLAMREQMCLLVQLRSRAP